MSLTTSIMFASLNAGENNQFGAVTEQGTVQHVTASNSAALLNGTGNSQAQITQEITATVNSTGTTYDLTALAGGLNGANRNYTALKGIIIENVDSTNSMVISPGAANGWTGINGAATGNPLTFEPGGFFAEYSPLAGLAVISGTAKTILIKSNTGTCNIKLSVIGLGS